MNSISVVIIPSWEKRDEEKKPYYQAVYTRFNDEKISVGFAPNRGVFIKMLGLIIRQEKSYVFLVGPEATPQDRREINELLVRANFDPRLTFELTEILNPDTPLGEQLKEIYRRMSRETELPNRLER